MAYAKSIEEFFERDDPWSKEIGLLRKVLLDSGLEESFKWSIPVYTYEGKNIVGLGSFKSYFGLWFYQGALLADKAGHLVNAQTGKTKAMRQWRMLDKSEIDKKTILAYIKEAVKNEQAGINIKPARKKPLVIPPELQNALTKNPQAKKLYEAMSLSKKREYAAYILEAKRADTKERRLQKILPMILKNIGLNDQYK